MYDELKVFNRAKNHLILYLMAVRFGKIAKVCHHNMGVWQQNATNLLTQKRSTGIHLCTK